LIGMPPASQTLLVPLVFDDMMRSHEKKLEFYNSGRTFDWPEF
jgi:hypothetical protein